MTTVKFVTVFKVPKGTEFVNLHAIVWAEPNMNWLAAEVRDVFSELADRFKNLFRFQDGAVCKLPTGAAEEWQPLRLPK
ncbi:hypothetical protein BV372_08245 [Nostoc sp. T09]|uniref:hypothetical protein n=1 Tax=Nostoc sp. T09 TaxID=1932621 RepID=UPI000A3C8171|nr:hypothetical protein [Nostoc sp. T09]OUL36187.1 hypothetical protein BV372_08245 [Nostoc sp. T09]